jgi:hypothetical protein
MKYTLEVLSGDLKAEMVERDTAAQTTEFVDAIVAALRSQDYIALLARQRG